MCSEDTVSFGQENGGPDGFERILNGRRLSWNAKLLLEIMLLFPKGSVLLGVKFFYFIQVRGNKVNTFRIFSKMKTMKALGVMTNIILNIFDGTVVRLFYLSDTFCFIREGIIFTVSFQQYVSYAEGKFLRTRMISVAHNLET